MATPRPKAGDSKPIEDIAQPGKSAPSATSKSIIVSNRPIMKDPMMAADKPAADALLVTEVPKTAPKLIVTPLTETAIETPEPATEKSEPTTLNPEVPAKPEPADKDLNPNTEPTTEASDAPMTEEQVNEEDAALAKHKAAVAKLVEDQTYFLPINSVEKRRAQRFVFLGILLIVVLCAAWADAALDAGLVHINGVKAPTHFFSN